MAAKILLPMEVESQPGTLRGQADTLNELVSQTGAARGGGSVPKE